MAYPGLPNWGYGAHIPVETLLQLLPFNSLPKRLSQEQLAQLQAQNKLIGSQTSLTDAQATEVPLEGESMRGLRSAQTRNIGAQTDRYLSVSPFAVDREEAEIGAIRAGTEGQQANTLGQWLQNAFFPAQAQMGLTKTGTEIQDMREGAVDRRTLANANASEARDRGFYYRKAGEKTGDSDLETLFNAIQAFTGLTIPEPVLDAKGRPVPDRKTGRPQYQARPVVTGEMVMPVLQQLLAKFSGGQPAGAPIPVDPNARPALDAAMGRGQPAPAPQQQPQGPPPVPTDQATLDALARYLSTQQAPQQPFRFTPIQEPQAQQPIQRFGPAPTLGTQPQTPDPLTLLLQRLGQTPMLQQFGPLVNR